LDEPLTFHGGFFSPWEKNAKRKEVKARFLENTSLKLLPHIEHKDQPTEVVKRILTV
jgi:hypothetical protein